MTAVITKSKFSKGDKVQCTSNPSIKGVIVDAEVTSGNRRGEVLYWVKEEDDTGTYILFENEIELV